jgi:hypothetical protein
VLFEKKSVLALWWTDKRNLWILSSRPTNQMENTSQQTREGKDDTAADLFIVITGKLEWISG